MKHLLTSTTLCTALIFLFSCASQQGGTASGQRPAHDYSSHTNMADVFRSIGGLQVSGYGQNVMVTLRGVNTFSGNTQPLYVINKIPMGTDYQTVNTLVPGNITDIQVVKSTYAVNRYGSLARNGAIMITTTKSEEDFEKTEN